MGQYRSVGWWEQEGLGRQSMENLLLNLHGDTITGSGVDVVAAFTLQGQISPDGVVRIIKQYQHQHHVLYVV